MTDNQWFYLIIVLLFGSFLLGGLLGGFSE